LLFNFLALQDPLRLLYTLRKSSSSYNWACQHPKFRVFKHIFLGSFHYGEKPTEWRRTHPLL